MLPLKTLAYLGLFLLALAGTILYHPIVGVYAYLATYNINPLGQWWGNFLPGFARRYSYLLFLAIFAGFFIHHAKLRYGRLLQGQEILLLIFLAIIWLSLLVGQGTGIDYNAIKMSKVFLVLLLASHIITSKKYFEGMLWVLILSGLYLGYELYSGGGTWARARFHAGIGGSDFGEGNFLAAHFGFLLPFVGILFLKGKWIPKGLCLVSGVFIINSIVLTRSRGIFIALAVGMVVTVWYALRMHQHRKKIIALLILGTIGGATLVDQSFWDRMTTIQTQEQNMDSSSLGRIQAWRGAWAMAKDHPLGVGVGQFFAHIGDYAPTMANRDAHNTYLRCVTELGFHGLLLLLILIFNAFRMLRNIHTRALILEPQVRHDFHLYVFATRIGLIVYLVAAMFITSVYIEEFYWLLMMPVFLQRALENEVADSIPSARQ